MVSSSSPHDPYAALRFRDFRLLLIGRSVASLGQQILFLAIGWELYDRTGSAFALGLVGLVGLIPVLALSPITGHVADHVDRKHLVALANAGNVVAGLGLAALSFIHGPLAAVYACVLITGVAEACSAPAQSALPAEVVPESAFENSASWNNSLGSIASIAGPALGGLLIAGVNSAAIDYIVFALCSVAYVGVLLAIRGGQSVDHRTLHLDDEPFLRALGEGVAFLRRTPVVLASITLDLFAVLFGGATTLLPVFAKDILHVGPAELGWLQSATAIGVVGVALWLAHRPPLQRTGPTLLLAVAGFGLATIVFGVSTWFWLSFAMLAILGGLDGISMIIRETLQLTRVPHEMRGRVAAIDALFVNSSNQLGGFESGVTAQLFGPVVSVAAGGVLTIVVVAIVSVVWPELRQLRTMRVSSPDSAPVVG